MAKAKRKPYLTGSEKLLEKLHSVVRKSGKHSNQAQSLIYWYMANKMWTEKQVAYIKTIVKIDDMEEKKKKAFADEKKHHLYAISDGVYLKLGYSCNIGKRLRALQTSNGKPLELKWKMYTGKGHKPARSAEKKLHRFMKPYHVTGEWYELECIEKLESFSCK
jgi:hypothetical protein